MRNNQPVTQRAYEVPEGATLMSCTDLKSRITYANAAFIEASGFAREALMGQPHNLVRHPDMPAEAFADMWRTLQGGDSWTALVKNRRHNGDHYWVRANAAPVQRDGQVVGYLSVRTRPQPAEVAAAEDLYARFREGRAGGWRFHKGLVVRKGLLAALSLPRTMAVRWRLRLGVGLMALGGTGAAALAGAGGAVLGATAAALGTLGVLSTAWLEAQIDRPLRRVLGAAQRVAAGSVDGDGRLQRVDEIGLLMRAVNQAGLNLRALVDDVGAQVGGLQHASGEIAAGSRDLSARTEGAASSLQQTAASMEQLHGALRDSATHARKAREWVGDTCGSVQQGSARVASMAGTMQTIASSAERIGTIVAVIDGLAHQTNLLALNAAVEAARAGAHGRGFAVVAAEVRSLAARSAEAAREIRGLVQHSVEQVRSGARDVADAETSMQAIVDGVRRVDALIGDITAHVHEQTQGLGEISAAVSQLDGTTQHNAALVEQSAAAAAGVAGQAARLAEAVGVFRHQREPTIPA